MRPRREDLAAVMVLLAATLAYALVVVKDFSGPLVGVDDINALEHLGFMLEQKITFGAVPHLGLVANKEMLYPFGTLVVFLPWGVERDLSYALLHHAFGEGPWLQLYQTASVAVSSIGTYVLLRREEGAARSLLVAFAGTFMNFYAVYKYPHHMNVSTMHWCILSITLDFVMFRRLVRGERWSARLLIGRVALALLLFGLDLGYVTGFGLLSLATTWGAAAVLLLLRRRSLTAALPETPLAELRAHPLQTAGLFALVFVGAWLYVPIVFDIVKATHTYHFEGPGGSHWAQWLRLVFPYLPFVGPQSDFARWLFGPAEGVGEFSVGWALLAAALLGLRDARRARTLFVYLPILVAFALAFSYHPRRFPLLRVFPWFQYDRVAGRATLVFPLWFALAALAWRRPAKKHLAVLGILAAIETTTAYAAFDYRPFKTGASFWAYERAIHDAPGEAVLDWPFCIAGGNAVATEDLCPYYALTSTTYAYRRFHKKDVVGLLLSRMAPEQAKPFYDLGLPTLFHPDVKEIRTSRRQTQCFDEREWEIFDGFYREHDFAGISLYPDLLPPGCEDQFVARYGRPLAETRLPAEGRAVFFLRRRSRTSRP
jgi:hypothetical protein